MKVGITEASSQPFIHSGINQKQENNSFFAALEMAIGEKMEMKKPQDAEGQMEKTIHITEDLIDVELLLKENPDLQKVFLELNEQMMNIFYRQDIDIGVYNTVSEFTQGEEPPINLIETTILLLNNMKRVGNGLGTTINMHGHHQEINTSEMQKLELEIRDLITHLKTTESDGRLQKLLDILETAVSRNNKKSELPLPIANMPVNMSEIVAGKSSKTETLSVPDISQQTVPKIEQFIMHVGAKQNYESKTNELIREFSNILAKSQLSQMPGSTRLLIRLYPEQLGSLRIELLQKDGMMMARIMASTNIAKNMLDSQLHHLKQSFIQQNIQVDKLEITVSQQDQLKYLDQDTRDDGSNSEDNKQNKTRNEKDSKAEFSEELKNVLFEMEV